MPTTEDRAAILHGPHATSRRPFEPGPAARAICAVLATLLLAHPVSAAGKSNASVRSATPALAAGDPAPALTLKDQHGRDLAVTASTRLVLFTRDMDGGGYVKEALADDGRAKLAAAGAVYVSDISRMPSLVRRMFALPALKKRPYAVGLDDTGAVTKMLPWRDGAVTVLVLKGGNVASVSFATSSAEVKAVLAVSR